MSIFDVLGDVLGKAGGIAGSVAGSVVKTSAEMAYGVAREGGKVGQVAKTFSDGVVIGTQEVGKMVKDTVTKK